MEEEKGIYQYAVRFKDGTHTYLYFNNRLCEEYLNNGKNGWIEANADQFVNVNMCKEIQLKREPEWHQNEVA